MWLGKKMLNNLVLCEQIVQEFYLGTYDQEATAAQHENSPNVSLQKDPRSQSAAQRWLWWDFCVIALLQNIMHLIIERY